MSNNHRISRFSQNQLTPHQMTEAVRVLRHTSGLAITPKAICLLNQVEFLCRKLGIRNSGKEPQCVEIVNKVHKVLEANPTMVDVWFEWCKREDIILTSQSAVECFDKLYQAALQ